MTDRDGSRLIPAIASQASRFVGPPDTANMKQFVRLCYPSPSAPDTLPGYATSLQDAPGTRISGGKNLPGKSPKAVNPVGQALRMAAMAARRSETFIGAKHRARLARMDTPVAIKATARELACLIYLMVTEGQEYVEQGIGAYEKRRLNRKFTHLDRQARKLGLQLVPKTQGEKKQNPMLSIA